MIRVVLEKVLSDEQRFPVPQEQAANIPVLQRADPLPPPMAARRDVRLANLRFANSWIRK